MGHQPSKVGFEFFKTLVVRDALTGEELCQLHDVDAKFTGLELKQFIRKSIKEFDPSSKRLLWGSMILCDHLTFGEIIACSLSHDGHNPNELSVLTRPPTVQRWLCEHKQIIDRRHYRRQIYRSWDWEYRQREADEELNKLKNREDIRSDVECMAALMLDEGVMLQHASTDLQDLDFLVMSAVKENGLVLQYASPRLQDTEVIVSTAVKQNGLALQHASSRLQDTDSIATMALKQNGLALQHASSRLQDVDLVVWDAVKQNGLALRHASSRLRNDGAIVRKALNQNGQALELLSPEQQDDWSIVYIAFRQDTRFQQYASSRIQARIKGILV